MTFGTTEDRTLVAGLGHFLSVVAITAALYVASHAITALCITPLQSYVLGDATTYASLLYLPHGIRVLSVWFLRWKAVPGLILGGALSEWIFTDPETLRTLAPVLVPSILVGALSTIVIFETLRHLGTSGYAGTGRRVEGRALVVVGLASSLLNSIGQMIVFDSYVSPGSSTGIMLLYAVGDIAGMFAVLFAGLWVYRRGGWRIISL
ncbi:hypothetical protein [Allosediminivita pacifica]|uniref:Uncharacterized protein n=1 Tax=Allosediminivita pacifica TaxID=1267769 RepID=A0A2T6B9Y5_9RHOB|nr:hypothetical protein [Allosediminivita pacifica]PTX52901.1 hypothetical protein C8N44_101192 [Allosediminivita pacifica]GGA94738.1 hypothetical protein GCM10011324_01530 [Allosediminivita pacifica]